jgi:choline dehydrogenase
MSYWPRGRVLGGSSSINTLVYVRGSRHDFDQWETEGCEGWSYKDVLPYFIKTESYHMTKEYDTGLFIQIDNIKPEEKTH